MINLQNVSFAYKKQKPLFQNLDLQMEEGHIYGFLGRNGAGKSTLMKIISGLLFPHSGTCSVNGFTPGFREVGFLSDIYFLTEELYTPAIKVSTLKKIYAPFYNKFDGVQFDRLLQEFEIEGDPKLTNLSYGQKKKVFLSFGLATNCRLFIMDEPTNGLDIPSKTQFRKIIAGSITENRTFIISTHQVRDMANLIDPIIILEQSKIIFQESLEQISKKLYFGYHQGMKAPEGALFSERTPGGYKYVLPNFEGEESNVELEDLFNTITTNRDQINELFKKPAYHDA